MAVWILVYELAPAIPFICAEATTIEKGTLLSLADGMIVAASAGDADIIAGVAAEEKIGGDGSTRIAVYTDGIFKAVAGGNCTIGAALMSYSSTGDANDVIDATNAGLGSISLGIAYDTFTDSETGLVRLCPGRATVNLLA